MVGLPLPQLVVRATVAETTPLARITDAGVWGPGVAFRQKRDGSFYIAGGGALDYDLTLDSFRYFRQFMPNYLKNRRLFRLRVGLACGRSLRAGAAADRGAAPSIRQDRRDRAAAERRDGAAQPGALAELFPKRAQLRIRRTWAGLIDTTPDALPVLGEVAGPRASSSPPASAATASRWARSRGTDRRADRRRQALARRVRVSLSRFAEVRHRRPAQCPVSRIRLGVNRIPIEGNRHDRRTRIARTLGWPLAVATLLIVSLSRSRRRRPRRGRLRQREQLRHHDPHAAFDVGRWRCGSTCTTGSTAGKTIRRCPTRGSPRATRSRPTASTYAFKLRRGAKFDDGVEITADDVVYSMERILALKKGARRSSRRWWRRARPRRSTSRPCSSRSTKPSAIFMAVVPEIDVVNAALLKKHEKDGDWGGAWLTSNEAARARTRSPATIR